MIWGHINQTDLNEDSFHNNISFLGHKKITIVITRTSILPKTKITHKWRLKEKNWKKLEKVQFN